MFIQKIAFAVSTLGVTSLPYAVARLLAPDVKNDFSQHLCPPGAIEDDNAFVKACIGCGLCGEICPPKCIKFDNRVGGKSVNTPYIPNTLWFSVKFPLSLRPSFVETPHNSSLFIVVSPLW